MQFMASISFDPDHRAEVVQGLPAEQARVRQLQEQGVLETLYVPDGNSAPKGVWVVFRADSRETAERAIASLPLYPYMQVELTPLRELGPA